MIITASQLLEPCFARWNYRFRLNIDPFAPPLGVEKPEPIRLGIDIHAAVLQGEEPQFIETRVLKAGMHFLEFDSKLELQDTEVVKTKQIDADLILAGRIDGIGLYENEPCIYELKTSRFSPSDSYWEQKEMDAQILMYMALTGIRLAVVDHFRVPTFSKTKWGDEWADRVLEDIKEKPQTYYSRYVVRHSPQEISEFLEDVKLFKDLIVYQLARNRFLRVRSQCSEFRRTCPYWPLCKGKVKISDCSRTQPFEELQPEIQAILDSVEGQIPF